MSKHKKLKSSELLLLFLYADNCTPIKGNTRFQKLIFIFEKELLDEYEFNKLGSELNLFNFNFVPHKFGPYMKSFYSHMEFFISFDMVYKEKISIDNDFYLENTSEDNNEFNEDDNFIYFQYVLSPKGKGYVENLLWNQLNKQQQEVLTVLKRQFNQMYLKDILYYVYSKYKDMTTKSEILEQIIKKEEKIYDK